MLFTVSFCGKLQSWSLRQNNVVNLSRFWEKRGQTVWLPLLGIEVLIVVAVNVLECIEMRLGST